MKRITKKQTSRHAPSVIATLPSVIASVLAWRSIPSVIATLPSVIASVLAWRSIPSVIASVLAWRSIPCVILNSIQDRSRIKFGMTYRLPRPVGPRNDISRFAMTTLLTLSFLLFTSSPSLAQDSSTITAIPPRLELNIKPGETLKTQIKVRNESSYTQTYDINITDFVVTDDSGTPIPILSDVNTKYAASKWIISPSLIPVDSKKTQYVNLTITAPQDAAPGGHYALLTYSPHSDAKPGDMKKTGSLIGQQTGTILYLTVPGAIKQNAQITRFRTDKFIEMGPVDFELKVKNLSDIHIAPKGKLIIKDFLGSVVSTQEVSMANIFPNGLRSDSVAWNQKWGYGKYQANLELAYGTAGGLLTATIFFWLFPIRLVTYLLILIISLLSAIILVRNRQLRHQRDLEKEVAELKHELESK